VLSANEQQSSASNSTRLLFCDQFITKYVANNPQFKRLSQANSQPHSFLANSQPHSFLHSSPRFMCLHRQIITELLKHSALVSSQSIEKAVNPPEALKISTTYCHTGVKSDQHLTVQTMLI